MHLNLRKPLAFIDLEATGVNVASDRIVEIAIIKVHPDGRKEYKPAKTSGEGRLLVNPGMPIPAEVSAIHGITDSDVAHAPTFAQLAKGLFKFLFDCDLAGYNSNKFDIPLLAEEFLRCGINFSLENRNLIDVQNIFHLMEQRTLKAAYKFYCEKDLNQAHEAMFDVEATLEVFERQLERYADTEIEDAQGKPWKPIENDMAKLHLVSQRHRNADLMGRIIYDEHNREVFNFGKHKGKLVEDVFKQEPGYFGWMLNGDFPLYTKKVIQDIRERMQQRKEA